MAVTTVEAKIEAALFARVASLVLAPALPLAWPNVSFNSPPAGYIQVNQIPNRTERFLIASDGPHRRYGLLQLSLFLPKNAGASNVTEKAGQIAAHFPADHEMSSGGVTVRVTEAPTVTQAMPDDTFWHVPITVRWETYA